MNNDDLKIIKEAVKTTIKEEVLASEKRLKKEISISGEKLEEKISQSEKRVLSDLGLFVESTLVPAIEEKVDKSDIDRIERKLDKVLALEIDNKQKIDEIASLPSIAHQLKVKK